MKDCILFAGQSNMSAYSPAITLATAPGYAQTAINEWTGASPASVDTGTQYPAPTLAAHPCLYLENTSGTYSGAVDGWGAFDKQNPVATAQLLTFGGTVTGGSFTLTYSGQTTGAITFSSNAVTIAAGIKAGLEALSNVGSNSIDVINVTFGGGSGYLKVTYYGAVLGRSAALLTASGAALTGTSPTLAVSTSTLYGGAGVAFSTYGLELSFLAKYRAARPGVSLACVKQSLGGTGLASDWLPANTGSNNTGTDRLQYAILKLMVQQAAARLNASEGAGNWRWAAFVWMQGESGAHSAGTAASDATYLNDARLLFAAVRSLTATAAMPVVIGRIGDNWTKDNALLAALGFPYAAIDYSATSLDPRTSSGTAQQRIDFNAGAYARRATQQALGADANCTWWSNDGYPCRPPFMAGLTAQNTEPYGYHWAGPGNMAAGERAFAAFNTLTNPPPKPRLRLRLGGGVKLRMRGTN